MRGVLICTNLREQELAVLLRMLARGARVRGDKSVILQLSLLRLPGTRHRCYAVDSWYVFQEEVACRAVSVIPRLASQQVM